MSEDIQSGLIQDVQELGPGLFAATNTGDGYSKNTGDGDRDADGTDGTGDADGTDGTGDSDGTDKS